MANDSQLVETINSILRTGKPKEDFQTSFREVVLKGKKAMAAFCLLRNSMNGEYTVVNALDDCFTISDSEERIPVIILDKRPFDSLFGKYSECPAHYDAIVERINHYLIKRPDAKVLTLDFEGTHNAVSGWSYPIKVDELSAPPMEESLDEALLKFDKKQAINLISEYQQGTEPSEEDLKKIAKTIYLSTFMAAVNLEYSDQDELGNKGCIDPMVQLHDEVKSFGIRLRRSEGDYAALSLARPAFWYAKDKIFRPGQFKHKIAFKPEINEDTLWTPLTPDSHLKKQYLSSYDKNTEEYMVANLKQALGA